MVYSCVVTTEGDTVLYTKSRLPPWVPWAIWAHMHLCYAAPCWCLRNIYLCSEGEWISPPCSALTSPCSSGPLGKGWDIVSD